MEGTVDLEVTRRIRWEAGHYLPGHDGDCGRVHGHSWEAFVTVRGPQQTEGSEAGMVIEMGRLAEFFKTELEPRLDHRVLNDTLPDQWKPPTTENVARYLLAEFTAAGFPVTKVKVRETENQTATAFA